MSENLEEFKHIKAWLDNGKSGEDSSRERRTNDRVRNVDLKGWYKKAEEPGASDAKTRSSFVLAPIRVVDISPTGVSIRTKDPLNQGEKIFITLKFVDEERQDQEVLIKVLCEVMRSRSLSQTVAPDPVWKENYTIGLRYVDLGPEPKQILEKFLRKKK